VSRICIVLLILVFWGCNKNEEAVRDRCHARILGTFNMVRTSEPPATCLTFLEHFVYKGKSYFSLNNYCADMFPTMFDCNLQDYCSGELINNSSLCFKIRSHGKYMGVFGVER
jgi:hypothetical protein